MNKIERLKESKETWKAAEKLSKDRGDKNYEMYSKGRVDSLTAALAILKRPSNAQIHVDAYCSIHGTKLRQNDGTYQICPDCIATHQ